MADPLTLDDLRPVLGRPIADAAGASLGIVESIFVDHDTSEPEWFGVADKAGGTRKGVVPVSGADIAGERVAASVTAAQVEAAPDVDGDDMSPETERRLYEHYGIPASTARSESVLPVEPPTAPGVADDEADAGAVAEPATMSVPVAAGDTLVTPARPRLRRWVPDDAPSAPAEPSPQNTTTPVQPPRPEFEPAPLPKPTVSDWTPPAESSTSRRPGPLVLAAVGLALALLAALVLRRRGSGADNDSTHRRRVVRRPTVAVRRRRSTRALPVGAEADTSDAEIGGDFERFPERDASVA